MICKDYSKDTRQINAGDIYIGIKGENFDGNLFWKEAFQKGAEAVIIQNIDFDAEDLTEFENKTIIKVDNTIEALYKIANYKRKLYDIPVIAVTGSVGKTSTKDIIGNVMKQKYRTLKTEGNNNNNIGMPFTILKLKDEEIAVLEMGMNHLGEIDLLSKIAEPTISVITNIGTSHIGNLGSRENILKAKLEILNGMKTKKIVINNDNDLLHDWYLKNKENFEIITYVMAKNIQLDESGSIFTCEYEDTKVEVKVPRGGIHYVYNAICAIAVGLENNINISEILKGIETVELTKKRMEIIKLNNGVKLLNDTYNASFESMQATLKFLECYKENRKIAVLGDMLELGEFSEDLHRKVGKQVVDSKIDILICTGEKTKYIIEEAKNKGMKDENIFYFDNKDEVVKYVKKIWREGDIILFKASNGMKFYDMVTTLSSSF